MCITPSRIHDECPRVVTNGFGKCFGTFLDNNVTPADLTWQRSVQRRTVLGVISVLECGNDYFVFEARFTLAIKG